MKRMGKLGPAIAALFCGAMAATSLAAGKLGPMTPMTGLHNAEFVDYYSAAIDEKFRIFVASPTFVEPGKKYPVIYVLDANGVFGSVMEMVRLQAFTGEIPTAFVVGIGYAVDHGLAGALSKRYRDLSPNKGGVLEDLTRQWAAGAEPVTPGGGPAFLSFLREEIKPAIEAAYPVDPDDATIGGASLAGLFLAWTLLTEPESFQRYIVISPSIWWNQEEVWQWEEALAAQTRDINATVFVTAGGLETVDLLKAEVRDWRESPPPGIEAPDVQELVDAYGKYGWPRMATITPEFVAKLRSRNYPSLTIDVHNMPHETHMSVGPGAWSRGLRYVFEHWKP